MSNTEKSQNEYDPSPREDEEEDDGDTLEISANEISTNPWDNRKGGGEKRRKDYPDLMPWKDNGIEVMLQPVKHMKHDYENNLFFFGPITEWKENISGEYLFKPKAFKVKEGEEPSLKGHYNSKNKSLYPKLIKSLNQAKEFTLQNYIDYMLKGKAQESVASFNITREGKSIYLHVPEGGKIVKKTLKLYHHGPVKTLLLLILLHEKEGNKIYSDGLSEFTLNKGDQPMLTLGWGPSRAKQWYDEQEAKKN